MAFNIPTVEFRTSRNDKKSLFSSDANNNEEQPDFVKTMYSSDLTKKSKRFVEENDFLLHQRTRNGDICYFRDILTQYQSRKHGMFKISNHQMDQLDTDIGKTKTKVQTKIEKTQSKVEIEKNTHQKGNNSLKKIEKENQFSNTMESYYKSLMALKVNSSHRQPQLNKHAATDGNKQDKHPIWKDKIATLFGIDQNKETLKKEELNIFKNLHFPGKSTDDKNTLPNLLPFTRRNTAQGKFETQIRRQTRNDFGFLKLKSNIINTRRATKIDLNMFKLKSNMEKQLQPIYTQETLVFNELQDKKDHTLTESESSEIKEASMASKKEIAEELKISPIRKSLSPEEKRFNYTSTSNFKRIEDFEVHLDEEIKVNYEHENKKKMKILNNFLSKFE